MGNADVDVGVMGGKPASDHPRSPLTLSYGMAMLLCLWHRLFNKSTHVLIIFSKNVRSDSRSLYVE